MRKLNTEELRDLYISFFESKQHSRIESGSLIPENDPTVLFTTAGMHPLVPFLLGESHPNGKRLTNVQKCIRTSDIDSVGDSSHLTFFEMLGNWSLGEYFKEDAIKYSYEFLTSEEYLNIPKEKLFFTCFKGDDNIPKDTESADIWKSLGVPEDHIFYLGKDDNFWILGSGIGPCGPCSEMYYDTGKEACSAECDPSCSCGKYLEIWNDVFMQYYKSEDGTLTPLEQKNVDTGMGLERTVCVLNNIESVYDFEEFNKIKKEIEKLSNTKYDDNKKDYRIIMDHIRSATFILGDDKKIVPSNTEAGYVLRRLIRRTLRSLRTLNIESTELEKLIKLVIENYGSEYPELKRNEEFIITEMAKEATKFSKTLRDGEKHFYKVIKNTEKVLNAKEAFKLFDTFGFPLEITIELAKENNLEVDVEGFAQEFKNHQEKSKTIESGAAKGGLSDQSYDSVKYHTLAHILLASLKELFGDDVIQKGCNINAERIRFDFNLDHKMTDEEKEIITKRVNEIIKTNTEVQLEEMELEAAKKSGAIGIFDSKYTSLVKVYTIGKYSKEICGGPHVENTSELGEFVIMKEESSSSGVRRIKAKLI
ncbi:MAG: alanine--tRNA ligase [bacterium]